MSSNKAEDPPEDGTSPDDLLSGEADAELAAAPKPDSFTIDDDDDNNNGEEDDVPTPLKERSSSSGSQKPSKSGAKMAKLSDKTSKIMNDYQAYLQEIETEFPSGSGISESPVDQVKESIRVGYRDNFAAPPPNLASMTKEFNPPSDTPLRRGWDYGDDEEEGSLNMRDHLVTRGQKYTHPLMHSRRFKKALCCTVLSVAAAVIIGVSVTTQKKKNANLPDWEGEYAAIEEKEKEGQQQQGDIIIPSMPSADQNPSINNNLSEVEMVSYEMAAKTYQPVLFDRTKDSNYPDGSYVEAMVFCENVEGYGLCPFAAICPNGAGTNPIRGVQQGGPSWNPVSDRVDEWVQIAADGKCTLASEPEWRTKGGNNDATRNLFCCKQVDSGVIPPVMTPPGSGVTSISTNDVASIEFDRSKDWTGQTYGQAADFCGQKGYSICPYDVICPDGVNHAPSSGLKPGPDGQWAPISDEIHDWVQVGTDIPCTRWFSRHPSPPIWSQTGEDNEEITRYIYCCSGGGGAVVSTADISAATLSTTTTSTTTTTTTTAATSPATLSTTTQNPTDSQNTQVEVPPSSIQWFDRSTGYKGQTYTAAVLFCMDFVQALPCTFEAICPSGARTIPDGGYRVPSGEAWVPIKESADLEDDNAWVSVSAENACMRYDRLHAAPPAWGETGEGNEEITRNVACCHERPPTSQPTPNPPTPEPTLPPKDFIQIAKENFDPVWYDRSMGWVGQTYSSAEQFCRSKSRVLCPQPAVCPGQPGAENVPFGGAKEGVAWVPLDSDNEWVQVGQEDSCVLYAELYNHPSPDWGLTGDDNESITRHIVCCRDDSLPIDSAPEETAPLPMDTAPDESAPLSMDTAPPSTETSDKWDNLAIEIFRPQWHTAAEGYAPSTHLNAQMHCIENGQVLCPMMAYCPSGDKAEGGRSPLLLGMERFPGEVWAPIGENLDFIQVGTFQNDETSTCKSLIGMNGGKLPSNLPKLGDVILCCKGGLDKPTMPCGEGFVNDGVCPGQDNCCSKNGFCADCDRVSRLDAEDAGSAGDANLNNVNSGQDSDLPDSVSDAVAEAGRKYEPTWLGREHGWMGGSYDDAVNFCSNIEAHLCPFQVYCPLGAREAIFPGVPDAFDLNDEHYSPVVGVENAWVNVGKKDGDSATTCLGYDQLYPSKPEWGLTAAQPEMKRYVLCCMKNESS